MITLVQAMVEIALQRRGPEDLPASTFLFQLVLLVYILIGTLSAAIYWRSAAQVVLQVGLELVLLFGFFSAVLGFYRKAERRLQTFIALLGTGSLLSALAIPLQLWRQATGADQSTALLPVLGLLALLMWSLAVTGHILHHAIEVPYLGGVLLAMGYFALSVALSAMLFPAA